MGPVFLVVYVQPINARLEHVLLVTLADHLAGKGPLAFSQELGLVLILTDLIFCAGTTAAAAVNEHEHTEPEAPEEEVLDSEDDVKVL